MNEVNTAFQAASQEMYNAQAQAQQAQQQAGPQQQANSGSNNNNGDDVTDVDFEEVK